MDALEGARTVAERTRLAEALADLHLRAGDRDAAAGHAERWAGKLTRRHGDP